MESIDALVEAVTEYKGGIIAVSHDQHFISKTCKELWIVADGDATRFRGTFDDYKKEALKRTSKQVAHSIKSLATVNA